MQERIFLPYSPLPNPTNPNLEFTHFDTQKKIINTHAEALTQNRPGIHD